MSGGPAPAYVGDLLIAVARAAHTALDDAEEASDGTSIIPAGAANALSAALDRLEDLPERPGYASHGPSNAQYALEKGMGPMAHLNGWAPLAAADVLLERKRQIEEEGFDTGHDDGNEPGAMAQAASCYAQHAAWKLTHGTAFDAPLGRWPWAKQWWKPKDPRRALVRAAALIIAEIERGDRLGWPK